MSKLLWLVSFLMGFVAILMLVFVATSPMSAPQQTGFAVIAIGVAVIPCCIAWSWSQLRGKGRTVKVEKKEE